MRAGSATTWTPDRKALALKLWAEGKSAAAIARQIGGVSRSAVIGVVNRSKATRSQGKPRQPTDPCARFTDRQLLAALRVHAKHGATEAVARALGCGWSTAQRVLKRLDVDYQESLK